MSAESDFDRHDYEERKAELSAAREYLINTGVKHLERIAEELDMVGLSDNAEEARNLKHDIEIRLIKEL